MKVTQHQQEDMDLDELLLSPAFRRFTLRVLMSSALLQTTHVADAPTQSAFAEGKRAMGLNILDWLAMRRPDALLLILQEQPQPQEHTNGRRRYQHDRDDDGDAAD